MTRVLLGTERPLINDLFLRTIYRHIESISSHRSVNNYHKNNRPVGEVSTISKTNANSNNNRNKHSNNKNIKHNKSNIKKHNNSTAINSTTATEIDTIAAKTNQDSNNTPNKINEGDRENNSINKSRLTN